jgi:arsenite-transporting ATPase
VSATYTFFAGKGGVGKTTCAAAFALDRAADGEDVLLVSTDPAHSLGDALDIPLGPPPKRAGGARGGRLWAAEIDAPAAFRRFLARRRARLAALVERGTYLDREDVERFVGLALPGVDELIALLEVARLAREGRHARVVVDTAPTGHTLRLVTMPGLLARVAQLLDDLQAKHRFLARSLGGTYRPDASDALVRELENDAASLQEILRDHRHTTFAWVTLPEILAVEETRDGLRALEQEGIHVGEVIVNRLTPPPPGPCALCRARRQAEAEAVARLHRALPDLPLRRVPALEAEPRGKRGLAPVARALRAKTRPPDRARPAAAAAASSSASLAREARLPDEALDLLLPPEPRLVLFAGKGGVGKTTCAAALALSASARGPERRWLLLSADPAHSLADVLARPIGDAPQLIAPGLTAREMDASAALEERRRRYRDAVEDLFSAVGAKGGAAATFDRQAVHDLLELAPPGIDEVFAVVSVIEALLPDERPPAYDTVVVDTAPTGHALRLLAMPDLALQWVQAILAVLLKYREVARLGALAEELVSASKSLRRLRDLLRDERRAGVVIVTRPAELPRRETERLVRALRRAKIPAAAAVVNAVTPPGCARCRRAARIEQPQVRALRRALPRGRPMLAAPAIAPPPRGTAALSRWAQTWSRIEGDA